ncbi:hypothetical protein D047_4324B, partial [Vibrio parahaemolyticus VPTS-2010_2]
VSPFLDDPLGMATHVSDPPMRSMVDPQRDRLKNFPYQCGSYHQGRYLRSAQPLWHGI